MHASTGQPVPGARVRLQRGEDLRFEPGEGDLLFTTTDGEGRYGFAGLNFGTYRVRAAKPGFLEPGEGPQTVPPGPVVLLTAARPHAELLLGLQRYAVIAGRISDATDAPLAAAEVHLLRRSMPRPGQQSVPDSPHRMEGMARVTANDRGEYRVAKLAPGAYYLEVRPGIALRTDNTYRVTYCPRTLEIASARPIEVAEGQTVRADIQIIQQRGFRVAGRLINSPQEDPGGLPRTYTNVYLARRDPAPGNYSHSGPSAPAAGEHFEITDVLPGQYTLEAVTRFRDDSMGVQSHKRILWARLPVVVGESDLDDLQVKLEPTLDLTLGKQH